MFNLQPLSILLEAAVVVIGLMLVITKKKNYGWLMAVTFSIYIFYDLSNYLGLEISRWLLSTLFFIASVTILLAAVEMYRQA